MKDMVIKNGKQLRRGYTTGTCATAASAAAVRLLLSGQRVQQVKVTLPGGEEALLEVESASGGASAATCTVVKHAGDDPDVTDGIRIGAEVSFHEGNGVVILGGEGVGVVTQPGLQIPPGEAAINPVPRRMIAENVRAVCRAYGYEGGIQVVVSAENGAAVAENTFNPRLGIQGGISILGTSGIVEPMSERALIETVHVLVDRAYMRDPHHIVISPGNYGRDYCIRQFGFDMEDSVKFSNFLGETLDYLCYKGFSDVLLVGHIGKLIKVAAGVMNTHSSVADCRMEILSAHAALCGADRETVRRLMDCKTTDEALAWLDHTGLTQDVMASVMQKVGFQLDYRVKGRLRIEVLMFASQDRVVAQTDGVEALAALIQGNGPQKADD